MAEQGGAQEVIMSLLPIVFFIFYLFAQQMSSAKNIKK